MIPDLPVLSKLESGGKHRRLERARGLRHLLPPRLGGTLALVEGWIEEMRARPSVRQD